MGQKLGQIFLIILPKGTKRTYRLLKYNQRERHRDSTKGMLLLLKLLLFPMAFACCESNIWNGITPLKSTRVDEERIRTLGRNTV